MVFSKAANMEEPPYDVSKPFPQIEILYKYKLTTTPGKSILGLKAIFPPGASTPPHRHHGAFVTVVVLYGSLLNKMNDDEMTIEKAGNAFYEGPKCRHRISDNASQTEESALLATMVLETEKLDKLIEEQGSFGPLQVEEEWLEPVMKKMQEMQGK